MTPPPARLPVQPATADAWAWRVAVAACLLLPLALLHARAVAEILIAAIDLLFLGNALRTGQAGWLRHPFALAAGAWWLWLVLCSALGTGGLLLAIVAIRLPVLALALGDWLLASEARGAWARAMLWRVLAACLCWIGLEAWQQYLTGSNLFGQPRWIDGALTGPFAKPRAGPAFILLFFPVVVPAAARLTARPGLARRLAGIGLAVLAALTLVLIGQRMPTALMVLGLAATALLLPKLRAATLAALLAGAALVAGLRWVSPAASAKLVSQTADQMAHFAQSDYGLIFTRALTVSQLHPWLGWGFDGFRRGCHDFWTMHGIDWLGIATANLNGGLGACNLHPHNYYLEALDNAGIPGLALFCLMVAGALLKLAGGITRLSALRAGLLVGTVVALWPAASTSAFTSMPNGGWVFLLLGLGFAAAGGNNPVPDPFGVYVPPPSTPMSDESTTDHGFIRAWAEAREGRPAMLEGRRSPTGQPALGFDFGTPEPGLREIAWDEFFTVFEADALALEFREAPGQLSPFYRLVSR